jgi:SPP1 family predicted phage head-tail adaptor
MMEPKIGELRDQLALEQPIRSAETGGGAIITWSVVSQVWAKVVPTTGGEKVVADGVRERITHEVLIRYRPGVNATMRLSGEGRTFEIKAAFDIEERKRWLRLLCEERLP